MIEGCSVRYNVAMLAVHVNNDKIIYGLCREHSQYNNVMYCSRKNLIVLSSARLTYSWEGYDQQELHLQHWRAH